MSYIADDHCTIANPELCAVVLANPYPLDKPECRTKPGDRLAHIEILSAIKSVMAELFSAGASAEGHRSGSAQQGCRRCNAVLY